MDKAELGNKHICSACGTKFYDLNKEIPTCPKCGTENKQMLEGIQNFF